MKSKEYEEQMAELDRQWNELVYGPWPQRKPAVEVLMVPVSSAFAAAVKAHPNSLRMTITDSAGVTRIERSTNVEVAKPDFAKSLGRAIADKGGKSV
jgi:hypothetical protein